MQCTLRPAIPGEETDSLREFRLGVARERLYSCKPKPERNSKSGWPSGLIATFRKDALEHWADPILLSRGAIQKALAGLRSNSYGGHSRGALPGDQPLRAIGG